MNVGVNLSSASNTRGRWGIAAALVGLLLAVFVMPSQILARSRPAAQDDTKLTNANVINYTKVKMPSCAIIGAIEQNLTDFHFTDKDLAQLETANVAPEIVQAMLDSHRRGGSRKTGPVTTCGSDNALKPEHAEAIAPIGQGSSAGKQPRSKIPTRSSATEQNRHAAAAYPLQPHLTARQDPTDSSACNASEKKDPFCIEVDWEQKNAGTKRSNVLSRSGKYRFHIINLNTPLYTYTIQGQSNVVSSTNDFALFADASGAITKFLSGGSSSQQNALTNKLGLEEIERVELPPPCTLQSKLDDANGNMKALKTALDDIQPKKDGKTIPSIPFSQTREQWKTVVQKLNDTGDSVALVKTQLADPNTDCEDTVVDNAAKLVQQDFPEIESKIDAIDIRVHSIHWADRIQYCERTAGCSISIQENLGADTTSISPANPVVFNYPAFYSQLSVSAGFLLTTLQARSYSSATAPDPSDATKTQSVLKIDGSSHLRPAMVALLHYHLPVHWLDGINQGVALSGGPVIEVANGKADTSKFGFFGGGTVHLWNRFFLTPGVHVGEFADFPQGFTHAGQIIPANTGTPTPTKRYTARFAFAITYKVKDLTSGSDTTQQGKAGSKPADNGGSNNGSNNSSKKKGGGG
jgi:DNA-binding transcriptional MerR regulator